MGTVSVSIPAPKGHRTMYLVKANGRKYSLGLSPATGDSSVGHNFGTIDRPGRLTVSRPTGRKLREISFEHMVMSGHPNKSIDSRLKTYNDLAESGHKVKISGGSGNVEGGRWWIITGLEVTIEQRATDNGVSRATLNWTFTEYANVTAKLIASKPAAKSTAKKKASTKTSKATPKRVHTVKRGDNLNLISKRYYGTTRKWRNIYAANKKVMRKGPHVLVIGWKLTIPK